MLKVGFFGTEGVGKTSVSTVLSFIMSYLMEEEGKIAAVMDADLQKGDLTNLLLGNEGFHGLHDILLGNRFPEEVVYDPLISLEDSSIRRKLSDLIKLKVIPSGDGDPSTLLYEPIDLLLLRLKSLEEHLHKIGVGLLLVDFPSSDSSVRILLKTFLKWVNVLIPILLPNKNSAFQTKRHLLSLEINPQLIPFVIINKCKRKFDSYEIDYEPIRNYWNVPTYLLPFDEEFSHCIQNGSIFLPRIHKMAFCCSLVDGSRHGLNEGGSITKHLIEIFHKNSFFRNIHDQQAFLVNAGLLEQRSSSDLRSGLSNNEQISLKVTSSRAPNERKPVPRDIYREIKALSSFHSPFSFFRKKLRLRYLDGSEALVSRGELREALLLTGLSKRLADSLTFGQELDLSSIPSELKKPVDLALAFLRLRDIRRDAIESK